VKILIDENDAYVFGQGRVSGRMRNKNIPFEKVYRHVGIGKYLYRDNADYLPRFVARVDPDQAPDSAHKANYFDVAIVEGMTVDEVMSLIDEAILKYDPVYQKLFPPKP